jgi:HlyD family secretion protein
VLRWALFAALAAAAAVAISRYVRTQAAPIVRYQTAPMDRGPIAAKVTASGTVSAITTVLVGSQVSGRIEHWYADFNTPVKKGQLIATIEPSLFRAAVEQAKANLASARAAHAKAVAARVLAERNYSRELALFAQNLAARLDLDAAEAQAGSARADVEAANAAMLQAQAALAQADLNFSYTQIHSPIDGTVISRNVDVGQTVAASFQAPTLFTIAQDLTKMQVDTNVAEGDVGKVREKMDATFTVDAYPGRVFHGQVRQVRDNAQTLQNVVTYDAVIDVDNSDRALRPTMTANCTFVYATRDAATRVPNGALRFKPDAATVAAMTFGESGPPPPARDQLSVDQRLLWIMRGGRPAPRVIRIGVSDGLVTEITQGDVQPGDVAITEAVVQAKSSR